MKTCHKSIKIAAIAFISFLLALPCLVQLSLAKDQGAALRPLVDASSNNFPPMNILDKQGHLTGFGSELSDAVMKAIGRRVTHIHSSEWVQVLNWLETGKADFIHDTGYTKERDEFLDYSDSILEMPEMIFVRSGQYDIIDFDSLMGKTVACVKSHISHLHLQQFPEIRLHVVNTPVAGIYELVAGKVDAFIYPKQIVLYLAQNLRLADKIKMTGEPLRVLTWSMVVKAGNRELLGLLNQGIADVRKSGEYDRIYDKWWGHRLLAGYSKQELYIISGIAAGCSLMIALTIALFIFNRRLYKGKRNLQIAIHKREDAEAALRKREANYRLLVENQNDLVVKLDAKQQLLFASPSYCKTFSADEAEVIGKSFFPLIHEDDVEAVKASVDSISMPPYKSYHEERAKTVDGWRWFGWSLKAVLDESGAYVGAISVGRDITEQKLAEVSLKETQRQLSMLMSNLPGMAYRCKNDLERTFLFASAGCISLTGYSAEQVVGNAMVTYGSLIHGADRQMVWNRIQKALRDQKSFNLSYRLISADRRELWVWEQGQGIFDADGNVIALEGFISDVTKTKHMEIALTESEERFNLAMEASRDGIFDWNLVTNAIYYSPGWKKMLGYPYHELPNDFSVWEKLTSPEDVKRSWKMQKELVNGERNRFEIEFKMKHKDGHWVDILSRANAYFDEKGKPVRIVGTHVDISQRKRMEEALHHALKMESIGTLAGGIAHDFNNILGIILGNTELALEDVPEWNPGRQNLAEVKTACLRAKGVVQQILSFSHKSEIHHEQFNPALVVEDSLKLIRSSLPTSIDIQKNISGNIHDMIGDSTQLHQIVINLCTNAAHAMEINGGLLDVSLENIIVDADTIGRHSELTSGPHVRLRVRDTGEGIPADAVDRVFDPYFTTKEVGKGTGLGLSVVHGIVTRHQGEISVESALGRGTTFEILFPAVLKRAPAKFSKPKELSTGSEHILLVDDEASLLNLIRQRLERLGYVVTGMTDAQAALALFESNPDRFDLIVTDMTMPQMTGDLLAQKILNVKPHMPIVLCTGYSEKMNRETARKLGIRKYIEKPIETAHLANVVREALDNPDSGA